MVALLLAIGAGACFLLESYIDPSRRTFRIGFEHSPPDQELLSDGSPGGPAIEIVREAARRRGIRLHWVYAPEGPEQALSSGAVDLWPVLNDLPGRRSRFFFAKPWCSRRFWLLVEQKSRIELAGQFGGRTVAARAPGTNPTLAGVFLPGSRVIGRPTFTAILQAVCTGKADGGLMWERLGRSTPIDSPPECEGHAFRYLSIPNGYVYASLGARLGDRQAQRAADTIRTGISELARDGTVSGIYFAWVGQSANDTLVLDLLEDTRRKNLLLTAACAVVLAIAAVVAVQNRWIRAARRSAEQARDCANRATAVKSEFLANMSHEIRTPLNAVMGITELAMQTPFNAEQADFLRTAHKAAQDLLGILNDILDLAKVEAGKLSLAEADFDLRECLEGSLRTLRLQAEEKGLALSCRIARDVPEFLAGDERRLRQVLLNLAGNAIKFTHTGKVAIEVNRDVGDPALLRFHVVDTGIGIPPEKQRLVFAPFEQADNSIARHYGGTGLGLTISSHLVSLMGGAIHAESPWIDAETELPAQGTAFHFSIRYREGRRPQANPAVDPAATRPLRVLLAEDNQVNRKLACRLMEKLGHRVIVAADGTEVLRVLEHEVVDVVLMDMQMPLMDGLQATRAIRLRESERGGHLPIVALTANALSGDRERCLAAGMDAYLAKPIQKDELARSLQEAAQRFVSR
ncbi:MAG: ATP-binding protein [Candidatus Solibacter sp.]